MQRAQVFLRDDQKRALKTISARTGRKQSDLIRRGVDLVIKKEKERMQDWKQALIRARGLWKDRDDLDDLRSDMRDQLEKRHDQQFPK